MLIKSSYIYSLFIIKINFIENITVKTLRFLLQSPHHHSYFFHIQPSSHPHHSKPKRCSEFSISLHFNNKTIYSYLLLAHYKCKGISVLSPYIHSVYKSFYPYSHSRYSNCNIDPVALYQQLYLNYLRQLQLHWQPNLIYVGELILQRQSYKTYSGEVALY